MSRDPQRIPKVLTALGEYWGNNPDLRLGQIMGNASIAYYTEDDKALQGLEQWLEHDRERNAS
ncbi:hypothetical protein [Arthrobacter sp. ISL-95]|uniref:hypothetical protein n=1 Tax=Arthrobacter sp. ISL-95 TaxID=2819116 RepID=UPI001BE6F9EA|nr:hypothetical protein [Arthrobacter sp. ISL-95]MBT2587915.1 hypothetical protein [Arthrobacter sp. ISL-95]